MKALLGITVIATGLALAGGAGAMGLIPGKHASGDSALIKNAMSAAPKSVSQDAQIVAMGADMKMRTLRAGTNGWTCMPDSPATPGPDPMCMDANAMLFVGAWVSHTPPPADKIGFMFMLAGGTDASNTDPYAQGPAPGNHWVKTGPHVMIVGAPVAQMMAGYPAAPDPNAKAPYVMWAGTPYEHLMIPVK